MRIVSACIVTALILVTTAQDIDSVNEKDNNVDPSTQSSLRLDPFIRKALLKALSDLEASDPTTELTNDSETTADNSNTEILRTGDDITEISPTTNTDSEVQYHSYVVDGRQAFSNTSLLNPTLLQENIIITTTVGNVENQVTGARPTPDPFNELFQTKESNNLQQVRSIQNSHNSNSDQDETKKTTKSKPTTTTLPPTPTTTTTPKPTHNDDGENIEEVRNRDVQVFQAPLVAAFTVHQDALGLPRKVVPIFQQRQPVTAAKPTLAGTPDNFITQPNNTPNDYITQQLALQQQLEQKQRILEEQLRLLQLQQKQQEDVLKNQQLLFQQKDAQRQQQSLQLEQQNKQEEERQKFQQQNLISQSNFQSQQPFHDNVQSQLLNNVQSQSQKTFQPQQPLSNFQAQLQNNFQRAQSTVVSVLPSVSIDQSNGIQTNQQLPNREAVDFLLHLRNQRPEQFPLQENHLPQGIGNLQLPSIPNLQQQQQNNQIFQQQQNNANFQQQQINANFQQQQNNANFQQRQNNAIFQQQQNNVNFQQQQTNGNLQQQQTFGNFQQQPPIFQQQLPSQNFVPNQNFRQANRVFRQESGTGNFGLNNNVNQFRFNSFQQPNINRFFRQPQLNNLQSSDYELQQLLLQSGLNGRSQEDINIVSKVLALNHGIGPNNIVSNRINFPFADSRRRTRKAPARSI